MGHKIYFSNSTYLFLSDYRLAPGVVTSANLNVPVKKITKTCVDGLKKMLSIRARTPLIHVNETLLLLDSYKLAPNQWYTKESYESVRGINVEGPYKLDMHAWCTLHCFVNTLPEWLYDNYTLTWYSHTNIIARTEYKSLSIELSLTAFSACDERMRKALDRIYTMLIEDYEQKVKQQRKLSKTRVAKTWSVDARYDNRLIVKRVEGEGVT